MSELNGTCAGKKNKIAIYLKTYGVDSRLIDLQEQKLRDCIGNINRYRDLGEVVAIFRDFEIAENWNARPGLNLLKDAIEQKRVNLVFVPMFRDLSITTEDFLSLIQLFHKNGCGLRTETDYLLYERLPSEG